MPSNIRRIGVLTGGGDCPGLNAVIRAVTKSALGRYKLEVFGIEDGFLGLIQNRMRKLVWNDVSNILTLGGTILGTSNAANPKRYAVQRNGKTEFLDVTDRVVEHARAAGLDALICISGDGTMTCAGDIIKAGINCIGVPKTIDNDLEGCERTFGFDTAVTTATECLDKIHSTAMSHHRVMVVEVMGRNAGWLALHAGVASGSDIILIPEIPYDFDKVCGVLKERSRQDKRFSILCVSEGAAPRGGDKIVAQRIETSPDPIRLGGIALKLAGEIQNCTGLETRPTTLGHIQRGGGAGRLVQRQSRPNPHLRSRRPATACANRSSPAERRTSGGNELWRLRNRRKDRKDRGDRKEGILYWVCGNFPVLGGHNSGSSQRPG